MKENTGFIARLCGMEQFPMFEMVNYHVDLWRFDRFCFHVVIDITSMGHGFPGDSSLDNQLFAIGRVSYRTDVSLFGGNRGQRQ